MRVARPLRIAALVWLLFALVPFARAAAQADCEFQGGFKDLHDLIPAVVGNCLEQERRDPVTGNATQPTANGILVWRWFDNWTAFTDGERTWVNGPDGVRSRPNGARFDWEIDPPGLTSLEFWRARSEREHLPEWELLAQAQAAHIAANAAPMRLPAVPADEWDAWVGQAGGDERGLALKVLFGETSTEGPIEQAAQVATNRLRAGNGLPPVRLDPRAVLAARAQVAYCLLNSRGSLRLDHEETPGTRPYFGQWPEDRARSFGASEAYVGENLLALPAADAQLDQEVGEREPFASWMRSEEHRATLLIVQDERLPPIAMGYAEGAMGDYYVAALVIGSMR